MLFFDFRLPGLDFRARARFPASRARIALRGSPDDARCCQMLSDAPRCCQMLPEDPRCRRMLPAQMLSDASRCCQVLPDAARWSQMSQMIPNAARCCQPRCRKMPDAGWCYQYQLQCQYRCQHKCLYRCQHQPQYPHQYQYKYPHNITKNIITHTDLGCFQRHFVLESEKLTQTNIAKTYLPKSHTGKPDQSRPIWKTTLWSLKPTTDPRSQDWQPNQGIRDTSLVPAGPVVDILC